MGKPLMPWQRLVADVGGELDAVSGLPAYRDVVVTVPRQSGKTMLILAWEIQRALGWGEPQRIVYSAQTGNDARKKLIEDQVPILEPRKKKLGIRRILKGMGNEAVEFVNGSRIILMASGDDAGHGKTVDLGVKDEFFADYDDRRDQALGPAMITRSAGQKLTASTAGTAASVPLNQLVARGRSAVLEDQRSGIAYFEWSAEPGADPNDPEVWWGCMPALGITMTEAAVAHERDVTFAGKLGEFRRAYLNIVTATSEQVIPAAAWDLVCSPGHAPKGQPFFGLDVNPERSAAAIVAAGGGAVEVVKHEPRLDWVLDWARDKLERRNARWTVDPAGPASSFIPDFEALGITVDRVGGRELASACGAFYDAVADNQLKVRRHPSLDAAVAGAAKRASTDAWVWARRSSEVDICPLMAATLAHWTASHAATADFYVI